MKKTIYFEPPKNTPLREYITIEYGKIRDAHIVQLASEVPNNILEKEPSLNKDIYMPLKNFHLPLNLKKLDKYILKQNKLKYTHEVILPPDNKFNNLDLTKIPPSDFILKGIIGNRKIFIKLNIIDCLILNYYSFSWSNLNTNQKISIIGIIAATIIGFLAIIFN